jgi:peroxiredoxin
LWPQSGRGKVVGESSCHLVPVAAPHALYSFLLTPSFELEPPAAQEEPQGAQVGELAPDFSAWDLDGNIVNLRSLISGRKTLLVFYRGGWCPFCNEQLAALTQDYDKFKELGATVVAASGEDVEKGKELLRRIRPPFALLSDPRFEGIDRYGVRDTNPSDKVKERGIVTLARPSAFIIDSSGTVRYKYVGKSARDRPKNDDLLSALKEVD